MKDYKVRAQDFIRQIFPFICDCHDLYHTMEAVEKFNNIYHRNVKLFHGIARIALITSDYVVKFDYNKGNVTSVGGCEQEIAFYEIAKAEGFDYLFAEITRFEYSGHNYYIMPRIKYVGSCECEYADEYMTDIENEWCDRHRLTDLHGNNFGFRNGHVCIVDYACQYPDSYTCSSSSSSSSFHSYAYHSKHLTAISWD